MGSLTAPLLDPVRAWWSGLTSERREALKAVSAVVGAILVGLMDRSLGIGLLVVFSLMAMRTMSRERRLGLQVALVVAFAVAAAVSSASPAIAVLLGLAFGLWWVPDRHKRWAYPASALVFAFAYPFFVKKLFTIPFFGSFPDVSTAVYMIVLIMMAVGLNIVVGYSGLLDLGYVFFYGTGAYVAGWLASSQFAGQKCPNPKFGLQDCPEALVPKHSFSLGGVGVFPGTGGIHMSIFLVILLGGLVSALFGVLVGLPTLRLRGDYLAIVTLGFGEILPQFAQNGQSIGGVNVTNGALGITAIDSPGFGNQLSDLTGGVLPSSYLTCCKAHVFGHQIQSIDLFLWTAIVLLIGTVFCSLRLRDSRIGRAWVAIREDETAAAAMGIPLMRTKTWAYASGAFFGGVAGAYYASEKASAFPGDFYFNFSVFILCMVILGGMGNVWGVIIGAAFLAYLNKSGLGNIGAWINTHIHIGSHHPHLDVPELAPGIYGTIILLFMLFRPEGLLPSSRRKAELHDPEPHDRPLYDLQHETA